MPKTIILTLSFLLFSLFSFSQKKQICITIDDLPVVSYGITDIQYQTNLTADLLAHLKQKKIPAIGFVNEMKLFPNDNFTKDQVELLKMWLNAGQELGNHTFAHKDYNNTPFKEYAEGIVKGEKITKKLLEESGKKMEYFRHPFLHLGLTKEKADSLSTFLFEHGYTVAPVSIDNDDYLFALAYHRLLAKNDKKTADKLGEDYLKYMEEKLLFYERQSEKLFGKNISQILLLHANKLNADFLGKLSDVYLKHGYEFVSMEKALKDPAYQTPITKYGRYGISWIDRWALSAGKTGDFFKGDPESPEYVKQLAK
ncbi:MAG: polysaccharide deacetylase family protein [Bacteroidetes bacterium]|nr:polysaccharide deacetylase family protein [Bacteroidota bacterium]